MAVNGELGPDAGESIDGESSLTIRASAWAARNGGYLIAIGALLALGLFMVMPVLASAFSGDDVPNSQIPLRLKASGASLWQHVVAENRYWTQQYGRFFPGSVVETAVIFVLMPTRAAYKAFQVSSVLSNIVLFVVTVTVITRQRTAGILAGALVVASLQIRIFHDPIFEFGAQQQILVALLLGTLLCFHLALDRHRPWLLLLALLLWVAALTTYETMYVATPVFFVALLFSKASIRQRVAALAVIVVPVVALTAYVVHLRSRAVGEAPQYTLNLEPDRVIPTLYNQASAALPGIHVMEHPHPLIPRFADAWEVSGVTDIALFVLALCVVLVAMLRLRGSTPRMTAGLIVGGLGIWFGPAVTVAVTKKWQDILVPGVGYVSVYVQYFGMAMAAVGVLIALVGALHKPALRRAIVVPVAVVLSLFSAYTVQATADANDIAISVSFPLRYNREAFQQAVRHGLLSSVPANATVASLEHHAWVNNPFILYYGGPPVNAGDILKLTPCEAPTGACTAAPPQFAIAHAGNASTRVAVIGSFAAGRIVSPGHNDALSSDVYAFVEGDAAALQKVFIHAEWAPGPSATLARRTLTAAERTVVRSGPGWALFHLRPQTGLLSVKSLRHDVV